MATTKSYLSKHASVVGPTTSVDDVSQIVVEEAAVGSVNVQNSGSSPDGKTATIQIHNKYTDNEATTAVENNVNIEDLNTSGNADEVAASDGSGGLTMVDPESITHSRYTDSEARTAVEGDVNVEDLVTNGTSGQVAVSNGTGLDMANLDHTNLSNVLSDQHHVKYTNQEARNAVIGSVNVEDLITASSTSGEVPTSDGNGNLTMQQPGTSSGSTGGRFFNSPFYAVSDGNYETIGWIRVPSGSSIGIQEVGVRNDLNNVPTGLNVVIYNVSSSKEELSRNLKYDSGSPLVTLSGAADFEVRVENNTGQIQSGTVFASAEGASSSGGSDTIGIYNTNFSDTQTTVQTDAPALNFEGNLVANWDSTNTEVDVDLNSTIKVDKIEALNNNVVDITGTGGGASKITSVDTISSEVGPQIGATSATAWAVTGSDGSSDVDVKNIKSIHGGVGGLGKSGKFVLNMDIKNYSYTDPNQRIYGSNLPIGWCVVSGGSSPTFDKSSPGVAGISHVSTGVYRIDLNDNNISSNTLPSMPYGVEVEAQDVTGSSQNYSWLTHYELDSANRDVLVQFVKLTFDSSNNVGSATRIDPTQFTVSFYGYI